jgi:outer membrane protein OmpA-like peptidoglycan-associated protein
MLRALLFSLLALSLCAVQAQTRVHSVYFGGGSYYIDGRQVQDIGEFIRSIPGIEHHQITVSSHTDNIGGAEYNQWLSQMRSRSVIAELQRLNLSPERINISDNGQFNPLFDNRTHEGRLANRRVDIILEPVFL